MAAIAYWMPKAEASVHEWEDGVAYSEARGRAAIADGASSSFDAQRWAAGLCMAFCSFAPRTFDPEAFEAWVASIADAWQEVVAAPAADDGAWYIGEAASRGSFATFCGVQVRQHEHRLLWRAMAVGDACLFHVRDGRLVQAFPVADPEGFASTPPLVTSLPWHGDHGARHLEVATGEARMGDVLYLATDAMAQWALGRAQDIGDAWEILRRVDHTSFAPLVRCLRESGEMLDDDTTLLRWTVGS